MFPSTGLDPACNIAPDPTTKEVALSGTTSEFQGNERRRSPRVRALYHVVITADGGRDEISVTVGRTIDVSETGVRLETPGHLCIDDKVRLEIAVEETVVNAARRNDLIEAGIEFTQIGEEDRLALIGAG